MKKTFNINVAGFPFTIDDDAYTLLSDYLDTIEHAFARQDDSRELIDDIESRIAELLLEQTSSGSAIVTAQDVEQVIRRVGQPEEMMEEDESLTIDSEKVEYKESVTPPPYIPPLPKQKKKLFRDPQNAMLGGVCAGLGWYLNVDPTVVRLLTVLLTVVSVATMGIAYLILWIVVPEARTPFERMQMMGEQPTVENIGKTVTDNFREENSQNLQPAMSAHSANFGDSLATFFGVCARILVIVGLIIAIPLLIAMVIGLVGCVFSLIMFSTSWGWTLFGEAVPDWYEEAGTIPMWGVICGIGSILTLGIPLYLLVRMGLNKKSSPLSKGVKFTLITVWILGLITAAVSTGRIINLANERDRLCHQRWEMEYEKNSENNEFTESDETVTESTTSDSVSSDSIKTDVVSGNSNSPDSPTVATGSKGPA
ncbi:MAG: PspC domain-containing protein [Muribaculaceae bacterium]|nr:PspC domain-containing protein [Muribaculaceae bacterium]